MSLPKRSKTTNTTTFFFREREGLDLIREHALVPRSSRGEATSIWSAGCGTGEEVYSLAIMAREMSAEVRIVGTDINEEALEKARVARYPERRLRHVSVTQKERWFALDDQQYRLRRAARSNVHLMLADVGSDPSPRTSVGHGFDVVLCRNVLMYLAPAKIRFALGSMLGALEPGGLLVLGAAEGAIPLVHKVLPEATDFEILSLRGATVARKLRGGQVKRSYREAPRPGELSYPTPVPLPRRSSSSSSTKHLADKRERTPKPRRPVVNVAHAKMLELRDEGDRELDAGRTTHAIGCYQRAMEVEELVPDLHFRLGFARMIQGAMIEALASLRRCLFLEPSFWPAALLLADVVEGEHPEQARRYLKQARDVLTSTTSSDFDLKGLESFAIGRPAALAAIERRLYRT